MQNYHIYEAVGRGKHSTVYKGRKKKTITYYAIKSVEKNQRSKVLQEVRTMHALDHENILKFFAWYETQNHLWLVLEYCVGGDLLTILRQDVRLPEEAVADFASDLLTALSFLHSRGLVYCDLKPSNILLDENGHLKLGDFGLTRRVTGDVQSDGAVAALPPAKRGTPAYMAPELFQPDGCHSACSDLYALGCCLYECLAGRPPFVSTSFTELVNAVLYEPPPPLPPSTSNHLVHLVMGLLAKDPRERLQWDNLLSHPFWREPWPEDMLPPGGGPGGMLRQAGEADPTPTLRSGSVDVMRLSHIARSNRAKEGDPGAYRPPAAASGEGGSAAAAAGDAGDVHLDSADAELNFAEEGPDDGVAVDAGGGGGDGDGDGGGDGVREGTGLGTAGGDDDGGADAGADGDGEGGDGGDRETEEEDMGAPEDAANMRVSIAAPPQHRMATPVAPGGAPVPLPPGVPAQGPPAQTPPNVGQQRRPVPQDHRVNKAAGGANGDGGTPPLAELLWHPTDVAVKPIVLNRRIDKITEPRYDARALPFAPLSLSEMLAAPQGDLEAFLTLIYKSVAQSSSLNEKVNTLGYFETLCMDTGAANMLINSSLMLLFVRMMRTSKAPALRIRLASVIGLLVRHATYITDELAKSGLIGALADALRDRNERLRRRAMAALGELLFYVATQQEEGRHAGGVPNPETAQWEVPASTVGLVTRLLRAGEDEVTQHYAVKAIENIVTHGGDWAQRFTSQDVVTNLATIYTTTRSDNLRPTAVSALARLLRHSPAFVQLLADRFGVRFLVAGISDPSPKVQQPILNLLNLAMGELNARSRALLAEEAGLVPALSAILEKAPSVVRAKALLCVALLCRLHHRWLQTVCDSRVLLLVDRLQKDKEPYVQHCVAAFQAAVAALVPTITDAISVDVEAQLSTAAGRTKGLVRAQSAGSRATTPGTPNPNAANNPMGLLPVLLHLLTSAPLRGRVVDAALLASVSRLLAAAEGGCRGGAAASAELRPQVLQIVEALSQHAPEMLQQPDAVLAHLLPTLATLLTSSVSGDCRFLCLKLLCDVLLLMLGEPTLYALGEEGDVPGSVSARLNALVLDRLLPACPSLLDDEDPIPLYTLKLAVALLEANPALVRHAARLQLAPRFFAFLALEHTNNNVHNVRLCRMMVATPGVVADADLLQHKVAEKVAAVLSYAFDNSVEPFMDPVLDICRALLRRAAEAGAAADGGAAAVEGAAVLVDAAPVFVEAAAAPELALARVAFECVALLRQLYGAATATALLTPSGVGAFITAVEAFEEDTRAGGADETLHVAVLDSLAGCALDGAAGGVHRDAELPALSAALQRLQIAAGSEVGRAVTRVLAALQPLL